MCYHLPDPLLHVPEAKKTSENMSGDASLVFPERHNKFAKTKKEKETLLHKQRPLFTFSIYIFSSHLYLSSKKFW